MYIIFIIAGFSLPLFLSQYFKIIRTKNNGRKSLTIMGTFLYSEINQTPFYFNNCWLRFIGFSKLLSWLLTITGTGDRESRTVVRSKLRSIFASWIRNDFMSFILNDFRILLWRLSISIPDLSILDRLLWVY